MKTLSGGTFAFAPNACRHPHREAMTLIEFVSALSVSALLVVGIHSSIAIALRGMPTSSGPAATALQANRFLDSLATELESAIYVSELTASSLAFSMPDRDGDGLAERVRYAWTGASGGALTRQYNGATAETLASGVDLFALTPAYRSVAETYPSVGIEDATESLLVDNYSLSGTNDNDVTNSNWLAQHFTTTLPAGSYAWRPTRVRFAARQDSIPGFSLVQMRPATATLTPTSQILEQYWLTDSSMTSFYTWQSFSFSSLDPLPSGGAICLVLQRVFGSKSAVLLSTNAYPGLERSSNNGSSWSYDNRKAIVSQLYGKYIRSYGSESINSNYLISMDMVLRMTPSSPTLRTTAALLNHPELLAGKWELKFDRDPTAVDVNGDGAGDWGVSGGGNFDSGSLSGGTWRSGVTQLATSPNCDFATTTVIDLKMQNTSVGGNGATFAFNALRNNSKCAPVLAYLTRQTDGTQTLKVFTKTNDAQSRTLLNLTGLAAAPVQLHLVANATTKNLNISVNDVQYGTFALTPFTSSDTSRVATIGPSGSNAEFSYVRIRVFKE